MSYSVVTPPAAEPLGLADLKAHLRVLGSAEDDFIASLGRAARTHLEERLGRALISRTLELKLPAFPAAGFVLPCPPLLSVTSIGYLDTSGAPQTVSPANYHVLPEKFFGRVLPASGFAWPATAPHPHAVTVRWVAGFGDAANIPADVVHALKLLAGHWYYNREAVTEGSMAEVPLAVKALTDPWRTHGWI